MKIEELKNVGMAELDSAELLESGGGRGPAYNAGYVVGRVLGTALSVASKIADSLIQGLLTDLI